ncbi:MAG TPA: hypothetical protein VN857_11960 [Chthoniobacterales bacterium]|jgi:hypothetical protein|nr:hypothetical protein [Chthoniobacterales bacterium]
MPTFSTLEDKPLTLAEVKQAPSGRSSAILLILLALPFCVVAIGLNF